MNQYPDRFAPLAPEAWSADQKQYAQEIINGPRGGLLSPFIPLMPSPELMAPASGMAEYLRYRSALGQRLSELAILITSRQWSQQVEWAIHAPIALREGVSEHTIEAIRVGRKPEDLPEDEAILYAFSTELFRNQSVCDHTYERALQQFGEQGVMDLVGINGYYSLLSMVMNVARTPVPATSAQPLTVMPAV